MKLLKFPSLFHGLAVSHGRLALGWSLAPTWRWTALLLLLRGRLILHRDIASPFAASHGLDIGSVLYGLREVADVADDVLVAVDGKRDDGLCHVRI